VDPDLIRQMPERIHNPDVFKSMIDDVQFQGYTFELCDKAGNVRAVLVNADDLAKMREKLLEFESHLAGCNDEMSRPD
jgi:hypothetical protein